MGHPYIWLKPICNSDCAAWLTGAKPTRDHLEISADCRKAMPNAAMIAAAAQAAQLPPR